MANSSAAAVEAALCQPPNGTRTDTIVIGSGPGGSTAATILAEAGRQVMMLEEGCYHRQGKFPAFGRAELEACWRRAGMTVTVGSRPINYVEGCCLGGGSEVNSGFYHRLPEAVAARWRSHYRVAGLEDESLLQLQEENERDLNIAEAPGAVQPASQLLAAGAREKGWACRPIKRWHRYDNDYQPLAPGGVRQSMSETFLPRFGKAGGQIVTGCRVQRITPVTGGWRVQALVDGREIHYRAGQLVLAAGAVNTPALLRASGIGNRIGNSLRMHLFARIIAEFDEQVNSPDAGIGPDQIEQFAPRLRLGCAASTPAQLALALTHAAPSWLTSHRQCWQQRAAYYASVSGGCGWVRMLPGGEPTVFYRISRQACYDLADGIRYLAAALLAAGARKVLPVLAGAPTITSSKQLWQLPRPLPPAKSLLSSVHLMGSCPMGEAGATDSFGRLPGVSGLTIADASLFCDSPNLNPQATVMTLARRNAHYLLENSRSDG